MEKTPDTTVGRKIKEGGRQMKKFVCFGKELSLFAAMEKAPAGEKEGARGSRASPGARPQRGGSKEREDSRTRNSPASKGAGEAGT